MLRMALGEGWLGVLLHNAVIAGIFPAMRLGEKMHVRGCC